MNHSSSSVYREPESFCKRKQGNGGPTNSETKKQSMIGPRQSGNYKGTRAFSILKSFMRHENVKQQ